MTLHDLPFDPQATHPEPTQLDREPEPCADCNGTGKRDDEQYLADGVLRTIAVWCDCREGQNALAEYLSSGD